MVRTEVPEKVSVLVMSSLSWLAASVLRLKARPPSMSIVTGAAMVPVPPREAFAATETLLLDGSVPLTSRVPSETRVTPL